ncbi:1,2-phenylacetyl-CoA epoxidase subunit PaaD [Filimonas effusa]|uniref:Phenylacetate-CoA oxygenase subunit PaaJ n=1 Tax=Filimonas effusa TaxID=2508721 RepID=A0A4Q1D521_9BACT|nr:1,2-phenylacetyl-CoA epoxidase subunit PaaD [Filimonas effusa]RXK83565.1 phenylacetate-CoA oxygenase subunit PaaJ [Filimonas effusa]
MKKSMMPVRDNQEEQVWALLQEVCDPEVPVLTILDLGVVRQVEVTGEGEVVVTITPTYSGCPAMDTIKMQIRMVLLEHGYNDIQVNTVLSPAWTTDWMTEAGRNKLKAYGIAPPQYAAHHELSTGLFSEAGVPCPRCNSHNTHLVSRFGATSCKSLYQCDDCLEPFDYFKCH